MPRKKEGNMMLGMVVRPVMFCVCMLMGCLNLFKLSGIGLDLACNLTVLLFLVYTLHGSSHYDLARFLLHGPVVC